MEINGEKFTLCSLCSVQVWRVEKIISHPAEILTLQVKVHSRVTVTSELPSWRLVRVGPRSSLVTQGKRTRIYVRLQVTAVG